MDNHETISQSNYESIESLPAFSNKRKGKLMRVPKPIDIKKITLPEELKHVQVPERKNFGLYERYVANFINALELKYPKEYLFHLYQNIKSLEIKAEEIEILRCSGTYSPRINTIALEEESAIYHELLHMATTSSDRKHVGFEYYTLFKSFNRGLNEGYTELLKKRLFPGKKSAETYAFNMTVAEIIEKIVGPKMEELFFKADLLGLIHELTPYSSEDEIMQFFSNVDFINAMNMSYAGSAYPTSLFVRKCANDSEFVKNILSETFNYLTKIYFLFLKKQFNMGTITEEQFLNMQDEFLEEYSLVRYGLSYHFTYDDAYVEQLKASLNKDKKTL